MDEVARIERMELAKEVAGSNFLTVALVKKLFDRVYVHPGGQIEIIWKVKDFCIE